jgi:hypothetical protein
VKGLYANWVKSVLAKVYELLPDCCYNQLNPSDNCPRPAFRWRRAKSKKKVSPTRNRNAHCCCAAHCNGNSRNDAIIYHRFQFSWFNRLRKHTCGSHIGSFFRWNCSLAPWRLASCLMALESRYEDLFREKKYHAGNHNNMADSAFPWHFHVLEFLCANPVWVTHSKLFHAHFFLA